MASSSGEQEGSWRGDESLAGDPDPAEVELVNEEWLQANVTFLATKCCKTCAHSSAEVNPLTRGRYARSRRTPSWPWRYGSVQSPRGLVCRICETAYLLGGFQQQHATMDAMIVAMADSDTLTEEFGESSKRTIDLINRGKITLRLRGKKRDSILKSFAELRTKTVEVIKKEGLKVDIKFKAIKLQKWKDANNQRDPKEEGFATKTIFVPGEGMIECVLLRQCPEGEYDVTYEASLSAVIKEQHDAGDCEVRENQADVKYLELGKAISGDVKALGDAKGMREYTAAKVKGNTKKKSDAAGNADDEDEADGDADASASSSSGSEDDLGADAFLKGSLLDGLLATKPKQPKPAAVSTAKPAASSSKKAGQRRRSRSRSPRIAKPPSSSSSRAGGKATGKGKASRIPAQADQLLEHEGVASTVQNFQAIAAGLSDGPFASPLTDPKDMDKMKERSKKFGEDLEKMLKSLQQITVKLTRRVGTPEEAISKLEEHKKTVKPAA